MENRRPPAPRSLWPPWPEAGAYKNARIAWRYTDATIIVLSIWGNGRAKRHSPPKDYGVIRIWTSVMATRSLPWSWQHTRIPHKRRAGWSVVLPGLASSFEGIIPGIFLCFSSHFPRFIQGFAASISLDQTYNRYHAQTQYIYGFLISHGFSSWCCWYDYWWLFSNRMCNLRARQDQQSFHR